MITYSQTRSIPLSQMEDLFSSVGWHREQASLRRMLSQSYSVHSAWDGRKLVGFARTENMRRSRQVYSVAVLQESKPGSGYQRHGIGRHLIASIIDEACIDGCPRVSLYAPEDARAFYKKCGFTEEGDDMIYRFDQTPILSPTPGPSYESHSSRL